MLSVAITLDGVLRKPLDEHAQDVGGTLLYSALVDHFRVIVLGGYEEEKDKQFLTMNGYVAHAEYVPLRREDGKDEVARRHAQVARLRTRGERVEFVIVADPQLAVRLYASGFTVLPYLHPVFTAESFRPDHVGGIRAWSELVDEVDYQLRVKAERRLKEVQG